MLARIFTLLFIFLSSYIGAQDLKWVYNTGGKQADYGTALAIDSRQNICDLIVFQDTISIKINENIVSAGAENVIIRKSTLFGIRQWYYQLASKNRVIANDIFTDDDDNIYVTGVFVDSLYYNSNFILKGSDSIPHAFFLKLNSNGMFLLAKEYASDISVTPKSISKTIYDAIVMTGHYEGTVDFGNGHKLTSVGNNDIFVLTLDNQGNTLISQSIGGTDQDYLSQHITDEYGNIYLTGDFRSDISLRYPSGDSITLKPAGLTDIFMIKLSSQGDIVWANSYGGTGIDSGSGIALDSKSNIILTGRFSQTVSFGSSSFTLTSKGGTDIFIIKIGFTGNTVWANRYGDIQNDAGVRVLVNHDDVIFTGGIFRGKVDFNPSSTINNSSESHGNADVFYAIYNQDGAYNQHFTLGGIADDQLGDIALLITGDFISTGGFGAVVDFDPSSNVINIFSNGGIDNFLMNTFICVNPYIKSIVVEKNIICPGESVLIQIKEGYLNDATQWSWQRKDCNSNTFASGDFLNIPIDTSTTFFVKGFGGCVTHDQCQKIDIKIFSDSIVTQNIDLCEGETIQVGNKIYGDPGTYRDTLKSVAGCDSIMTTNINVYPKYFATQNVELCNGDSIIVGSSVYTLPGNYTNILHTIHGCDSIIITNVSILPANIERAEAIICKGDSVIIKGIKYDKSGIFIQSTPNPSGCTDMFIVTIIVLETNFNVQADICTGESYLVAGNTYTKTGIYTDSLKSNFGCDSIIITTLTVHEINNTNINYTICPGDSITINGQTYYDRHYQIDSLQNTFGCDSIVYTSIDVYPVIPTQYQDIRRCQGDTLYIGSNFYVESGTYIDTLISANGCDSIVQTVLSFIPTYTNLSVQICEGDIYTNSNQSYDKTGQYFVFISNSLGCDSILRINLNVLPTIKKTFTHNICPGESVIVGGNTYFIPGIYKDTLVSFQGCDSIVTSNLVYAHNTKSFSYNICSGEIITINNKKYTLTGTYTDTLQTIRGCDSILIIRIVSNPKNTIDTLFEICKGSGIRVGNSTYFNAGKYQEIVPNQYGCDSTINFEIVVINFAPSITVSKDTLRTIEIQGAKYQWYICKDNEQVPILGATSPVYAFAASGNYAIAVTYKGCTYLSTCLYVTSTSTIDDLSKRPGLPIYPNPATQHITVEVPADGTLFIRSVTGTQILNQPVRQNKIDLDISTFSAGTYIIEWKSLRSEKIYYTMLTKI